MAKARFPPPFYPEELTQSFEADLLTYVIEKENPKRARKRITCHCARLYSMRLKPYLPGARRHFISAAFGWAHG
jgi:hypothetical protein